DKVREVAVKKHSRKMRNTNPEILKKEQILSEVLGTKVKIKKSKSGGQVIIECYSDEELNSIITNLTSKQ
ncbi:unnamed protein product, partial [marine sediment metagenome]